MMPGMSILGNRVIRTEDPRLLTGEGGYVDGVKLSDARYVHFVRSTVPHGLLVDLDVDAARSAPGVVAVWSAEDLGFGPVPAPDFFPSIDTRFYRWPLAKDRVRFVGEPIVAILAETRYQAADAAELVTVDYEPLPVVMDIESSRGEATLLFPELGTNRGSQMDLPEPEGLFDGADVRVRLQMVNQRIAVAPMEGRAAAATWDGERLTYHASTQGIGATQMILAAFLGLDQAQVRVIAADVGGGFGSKGGASAEEVITAMMAHRLGGTVRWAETRTENLTCMNQGRGQIQTVEIGATGDGRIVGLHMDIQQEAGAYVEIGAGLPVMTMLMASGTYAIPRIWYTSSAWVTNTTPMGAFRGAGRPEAAYAIERAMDYLAHRLGMDPAELRRRNLIPPDAFPVTTAVGTVYDSGDYATALDKALDHVDYPGLRAEQQRRRANGDAVQLGVGISSYVEITGNMPGPEPAKVEVHADGSATVYTGSNPHGQGHITTWAMVASDRLGIPFERVSVVYGDTDLVTPGGLTGGSRSAQVCGVVVGRASDAVVDQAKATAAGLLEASPDDIVLDPDTGGFHVAGTPALSKSWAEVVAAAGGLLAAEESFTPEGPTYPFGANVAVVSVDTETGRVTLDRLVGCDDAGTLLNPLLADGQLHGGMASGAAQALIEEVAYDDEGNPLTSTLATYSMISAAELPSFELVHMETPTPLNELGAKGIGESGVIGTTPCVVNAVVDALAHLGITHLDMPLTSERVWQAIRAAH